MYATLHFKIVQLELTTLLWTATLCELESNIDSAWAVNKSRIERTSSISHRLYCIWPSRNCTNFWWDPITADFTEYDPSPTVARNFTCFYSCLHDSDTLQKSISYTKFSYEHLLAFKVRLLLVVLKPTNGGKLTEISGVPKEKNGRKMSELWWKKCWDYYGIITCAQREKCQKKKWWKYFQNMF